MFCIKEITGKRMDAADGQIGKTRDFLFDDIKWVIRYLVADTGNWLSGRQVLISPYFLNQSPKPSTNGHIAIGLTRDQIEKAPGIETDLPVSRRHEQEMAMYYAYPSYWGAGTDLWGVSPYPVLEATHEAHLQTMQDIDHVHLRSSSEVSGYHIHATNGLIGHVEDFLVEEQSWAIRYAIVDTRNWLPGRKVLVSPAWIESVDWSTKEIRVMMNREAVKESPLYQPDKELERQYEESLYQHYRHLPYW